MPNTTIQLKKSSTPSAVPPSLEFGELAINYADGKLYYKNTNSQIVQVNKDFDNFGTVNANGVLIIADTTGDVFSLEQGSNIIIVGDAVNDKITISADLTVANTYAASVGAAANGWANTISATRAAASNGWANTVGASDRDFANGKFLANTSGVSFNGNLFFPTGNVGIGTTSILGRITALANGAGDGINTNIVATVPGTAQGQRSSLTFYSTFQGTGDNGPRRTSDIISGYNATAWGGEYLAFHVGNNGVSNDGGATTSEKIRLTSTGLGIGITSPTSNLHVIGTANITGILAVGNTVNALDFNSTSDIKYKTGVQSIEYALDTVSKLRGVSFTWKESQKPSYGLIAQEVQNVIPEIVSTNDISLSLNYDALIGHLIESIKELKSRIEVLEKNVINKREQPKKKK